MIANVNRGKGSTPVSPADIMPKYGVIGETMPEPEQMKKQLLATFGSKIKRQKRADGA